ncbi:RNA polymerase sigma factor [Membranihabitans maritimus]|uniref:RNA polymerase sigma factor n=1 Tax=Membranihabitans maritimus TaxID=2904244 RepID=UPI001F007FBE|nr:RNA polymerase sigma-70 factor [Membranihabitans maritimus]
MIVIDEIIEKYYSRVYAFALTHVKSETIAEDLTQDIFLQLVKKESHLQNIEDLEAYIFTATRYATYHYFKKIRRNEVLKEEMLNSMKNQLAQDEDHLLVSDLEKKFHDIIYTLPERQREIFQLSREKGLTHNEIAKKLQISPSTVKNHMVKALKTLRHQYTLISSCIVVFVIYSIYYFTV